MLMRVRCVWSRLRWFVLSNDAACSDIVAILCQFHLDRLADYGVLASEIVQELRLGPNKVSVVISFGVNICHVGNCSSWGVRERIEYLIPPDELCKRVENWTRHRTKFTIGISSECDATSVIDVAELVEVEWEDSLIGCSEGTFHSSLHDCRVAWHLAELQLKIVGKCANSVGRLVEFGGDVLELWWWVLLVGGPPTRRLVSIVGLERVVGWFLDRCSRTSDEKKSSEFLHI